MDKETLSNYGWIVICVLVLAVMLALATPFGSYISDAIKSTSNGLFDVNQGALDAAGITIGDQTFENAESNVPVTYAESFAENSWATIAYACQHNEVPESWKIGDTKTLMIDGNMVEIKIIGKNHDIYADGSGTAPLTFMTNQIVGYRAMNLYDCTEHIDEDSDGLCDNCELCSDNQHTDEENWGFCNDCWTCTKHADNNGDECCDDCYEDIESDPNYTTYSRHTIGSWDESEMCKYINNELSKTMEADVVSNIKTVKKITNLGGYGTGKINTEVEESAERFFLLSSQEVSGCCTGVLALEGKQYEYFANGGSKILCDLNGVASYWWLRTPDSVGNDIWSAISSSGNSSPSNTWKTHGIAFAFCF